MKLADIFVPGFVLVVCLSRLPSPLRSLKSDLVAKSRLTMLSAVCQLVGFLGAGSYFATRVSTVEARHPEWAAVEIVGLFSLSLILRPGSRSFVSNFFSRKPMRHGQAIGIAQNS
jgi:hypothetical protein